ncbi:MAG: hypothetical protein OXC00_15405, partial [Acidimicrobiaceae bacterium]|nr:hypothetical protein [Acidimicrobiaceae bacterium]
TSASTLRIVLFLLWPYRTAVGDVYLIHHAGAKGADTEPAAGEVHGPGLAGVAVAAGVVHGAAAVPPLWAMSDRGLSDYTLTGGSVPGQPGDQ